MRAIPSMLARAFNDMKIIRIVFSGTNAAAGFGVARCGCLPSQLWQLNSMEAGYLLSIKYWELCLLNRVERVIM